MISIEIVLRNIRLIATVIVCGLIVWFWQDYRYQKAKAIRQAENARQQRVSDSLKYSAQILTSDEIKEYLEYNRKDLKDKLRKADIRVEKVKEIISTKYIYRDTVSRTIKVDSIVNAIKSSIPREVPWADSTKCWTEKGSILFDGENLSVVIKEREFKNNSDIVSYLERKEWKFLGIKTRFLGKLQLTSTTFDDCGQTRTLRIEKFKK